MQLKFKGTVGLRLLGMHDREVGTGAQRGERSRVGRGHSLSKGRNKQSMLHVKEGNLSNA